jgi:hypothetical protein
MFSGSQGTPGPAQEWYLWRYPELVEKQDIQRGESELWRRGPDGQVFYERVFHQDKRIIEYVPGELRALRKYPDWQKLSQVIEPAWLQRALQHTGTTEILGRHVRRYQGQVDGVTFEVLWLEAEQLPALVRQVYADREAVLRLKAIYAAHQAPWSRAQTKGYQRLDAADLGDMYADPFVRRVQHSTPLHSHTHTR